MHARLISEHITSDISVITEAAENGNKSLYITGPFLVAETANKNKRSYPMRILEREVERYKRDFINEKRAFGELGHPSGPSINLERVSHMIVGLDKDKNAFIGKAKIMETPYGQIAKNFIESGAKLGVSSRGLGSLVENKSTGLSEIQDDFFLATPADIVHDPSAPGAFVNGIMENVEYWYDSVNDRWIQKAIEESHYDMKKIAKRSARELNEMKLVLFERFMSRIAAR